jgi:DNA-directed RNA polymerase
MPIVQPYRNARAKTITTYMQKLNLSDPHRSDPVSKRKQLQGFPPNFIHSLDATHMLLSALRCDELGLSFAAVHDSFWTHARDIETMNTVLRDTFIRIHSEDVIGRLAAEFAARYKDGMYLAKVRIGSLLHQKIQAWRESQSAAKDKEHKHVKMPKATRAPRLDELLLEYERMKLLGSSDPQDVERGREMVTPASLFEEMASEGDLAADEELEALGLGDISPREARLSADQEVEVGDPNNMEEISNPHPGGIGADVAMDADGQDILGGNQDVDADESSVESEEEPGTLFEKSLTPRPRKREKFDHLWLPMSLPPVPKKVCNPICAYGKGTKLIFF